MEDNVEHPVEPVFDAPMGADCGGEGLGIEFDGREVIAPFRAFAALPFDMVFDHGDHREMGKMGFIRIATVGKQPLCVVTDAVAAFFDAAMIGVGCRVRRQGDIGGRIGKERHDIGKQRRTVALQREQIISAARHDGLGNRGLCSDRIDGDERTGQFQPFEQQRDRGDLVGLYVYRFLALTVPWRDAQAETMCSGARPLLLA